MKVTLGHKVINLEELFQISQLNQNDEPFVEVVVDSAIYSELSKAKPKETKLEVFTSTHEFANNCSSGEVRAIIAAKIVQLLKLKINCQKAVIDSLLSLLNGKAKYNSDLFATLYGHFEAQGVFPSEKERFLLNSLPIMHVAR